jgi:hypothetical protein
VHYCEKYLNERKIRIAGRRGREKKILMCACGI